MQNSNRGHGEVKAGVAIGVTWRVSRVAEFARLVIEGLAFILSCLISNEILICQS